MKIGVNLDVKCTKCFFIGYCEGTKAYRLMKTNNVIKSRDVTNIVNDLIISLSGRNEALVVFGVDKYSTSSLIDVGGNSEECEEQVGDNHIAIQEVREGLTSKVCSSTPPSQDKFNEGMQPLLGIHGEGHPLEEQRYPSKEHRPLGEWWKNHILPQHSEERANVAYIGDSLKLWKATCVS